MCTFDIIEVAAEILKTGQYRGVYVSKNVDSSV